MTKVVAVAAMVMVVMAISAMVPGQEAAAAYCRYGGYWDYVCNAFGYCRPVLICY
jgi:hypothetical protein